jgi:NADP-dependent 3-hydroxy acid dehydrogenase YdfG
VSALANQTVVVIGGSAGIGLETARLARAEGADVIQTARSADKLERAAQEVGARSTAAFDATDPERLAEFFDALAAPIDHVMLSGAGPYYAPLPIGRVVGPAMSPPSPSMSRRTRP